MSLLGLACARLQERGVQHALIGAAALGLHGVSRATNDLDLFTTDRRCLDESFWEGALPDVTVDRRRGGLDDPLAGVVRLSTEAAADVDIVVGKHRWQEAIVADAQPFEIDGVKVPVVRARDLVRLKLFAGGPQDAWDIESLLALDATGVLAREVASSLDALPVDARKLWQRIQAR